MDDDEMSAPQPPANMGDRRQHDAWNGVLGPLNALRAETQTFGGT